MISLLEPNTANFILNSHILVYLFIPDTLTCSDHLAMRSYKNQTYPPQNFHFMGTTYIIYIYSLQTLLFHIQDIS